MDLGASFSSAEFLGVLDTGQGSIVGAGHKMLRGLARLMVGALLEHPTLGPWPLRDPRVHLSRPKAPFHWLAHACAAGALEIQRCIGSAFLTLTEAALPLPPFPRHLARSRFTLHASLLPPREAARSTANLVVSRRHRDALELIAAVFPIPLFVLGISSSLWISIASPRHSVDTTPSKLRLSQPAAFHQEIPFRRPKASLWNLGLA